MIEVANSSPRGKFSEVTAPVTQCKITSSVSPPRAAKPEDRKQGSPKELLDKEVESSVEVKKSPRSPQKSIKNEPVAKKNEPNAMVELKPKLSPSRTDTDFYDGKAIVNKTEPKQ